MQNFALIEFHNFLSKLKKIREIKLPISQHAVVRVEKYYKLRSYSNILREINYSLVTTIQKKS